MTNIIPLRITQKEAHKLMLEALNNLDRTTEIFGLLQEYNGSVNYYVIVELIYMAFERAEHHFYEHEGLELI